MPSSARGSLGRVNLSTKQATWLAVGGFAVGLYALYIVYQNKTLGLGSGDVRFVTGRAREAPALESNTDGGITTTHRRSAEMPIDERVASIQAMIFRAISSGPMRKLALQITSSCEARDKMCEATAIDSWVRQNIRYTGDIGDVMIPGIGTESIDVFQSPARTIEFGGGDCDDHAGVVCCLLALNGINSFLVVTSETKSDDWSHIYGAAKIDGKNQLVALDTTLPNSAIGDEAPCARKLIFPA